MQEEEVMSMEMESCVPPGFRFHPTEEELVGYYLKRKINLEKIDLDVIVDIDLYKMEPWDIQDSCKLGYDEQKEWYFFSHKDKKYPTGTRTNRATAAGFWKATGRDKAVLSKNRIIGMRKTLVFYRGRAPNGRKSDWIMHEYRLQTSEHGPPQEEGWVVCRAFKKPSPNHSQQGFDQSNYWRHPYYVKDESNLIKSPSFSDVLTETDHMINTNQLPIFHHSILPNNTCLDNQLIELPNLDSPTISTSFRTNDGFLQQAVNNEEDYNRSISYVDWKDLDNLLVAQPSETVSYPHSDNLLSENQHSFGNFPHL